MSSPEEREIARLRAQAAELRTAREIARLKTEIEELKATTPKPKKPPLPYGGLCEGPVEQGLLLVCGTALRA
jgi:hypothetical protein